MLPCAYWAGSLEAGCGAVNGACAELLQRRMAHRQPGHQTISTGLVAALFLACVLPHAHKQPNKLQFSACPGTVVLHTICQVGARDAFQPRVSAIIGRERHCTPRPCGRPPCWNPSAGGLLYQKNTVKTESKTGDGGITPRSVSWNCQLSVAERSLNLGRHCAHDFADGALVDLGIGGYKQPTKHTTCEAIDICGGGYISHR